MNSTDDILTRKEFFTLCAKIILLGNQYNILIAAPTRVLSKDFAQQFIGIYSTVPTWLRKKIIHTTQTSFKFDDGSWIRFESNPKYARGLSLSFAGIYVGGTEDKKFKEWTECMLPALPPTKEIQTRLRRFM